MLKNEVKMKWVEVEELIVPAMGLSGGLRRYKKLVPVDRELTLENSQE